MSSKLEQLQTRKTELEEEAHSLEEKQKELEERVKILETNIAIKELENKNRATREAIAHLESTINALEEKMNQFTKTTEPHSTWKEEQKQEPEQVSEIIETSQQEEDAEETVTVTAVEGSPEQEQEEFERSIIKQHEKKRRKLF